MRFTGFLQLLKLLAEHVPDLSAFLTAFVAAKGFEGKLGQLGALLDKYFASAGPDVGAVKALALSHVAPKGKRRGPSLADSNEQEKKLAEDVCLLLNPVAVRAPGASASTPVAAASWDLTKLKTLFEALQPYLSLLLALLGK